MIKVDWFGQRLMSQYAQTKKLITCKLTDMQRLVSQYAKTKINNIQADWLEQMLVSQYAICLQQFCSMLYYPGQPEI